MADPRPADEEWVPSGGVAPGPASEADADRSAPSSVERTGAEGNVVALGVTSMFTDISSEMIASVLPLYLTLLYGFTPLQFGVFDGLYQGMAALIALAAAVLADRRRRLKEMAGIGYGLSTICTVGLVAAQGAWLGSISFLYLDRLGKGIRTAPRDALISLSVIPARLGRAFGLHRAFDTVGAVIGPVLASIVLARDASGYQSVFLVGFFASMIGLACLTFFVDGRRSHLGAGTAGASSAGTTKVRRSPAAGPHPFVRIRAEVKTLVAHPTFRLALLFGGALAVLSPGDGLLFLTFQREASLSTSQFPLLYVGGSLVFLLGSYPVGRLADRIGRWRVFLGGAVMQVGLLLVLGSGQRGPLALCALVCLLGARYAATDGVLMALASSSLPASMRASGLALLVVVLAGGHLVRVVVVRLVVGVDRRAGGGPLVRGCVGRGHGCRRSPPQASFRICRYVFVVGRRQRPAGGTVRDPGATAGRAPRRTGRIVAFGVVCALCLVGAGVVVIRGGPPSSGGAVAVSDAATLADIQSRPHAIYIDTRIGSTYRHVELVDPSEPGDVVDTGLVCDRVDMSGGRGVCLRADRGVITTYEAIVFDEHYEQVDSYDLPGFVSHARVSPDGTYGAWTTFVSGDSYLDSGFSTRTHIANLRTGESVGDLESFPVMRDGKVFSEVDFNFWGVTFAGDDDRFYATLGTGGHTYLVEGDLTSQEMTVLRDGVECPSLSPDGTRVAYKRRVTGDFGRAEWRLAVLDLETMTDHEIAETGNVDDQVGWLDDSTLTYGIPHADSGTPTKDTWAVPADGSGSPQLLVEGAWSLGQARR